MHRHGIVGALWNAAWRLATARHGIRLAAVVVLTSARATGAGAMPVEYDYTGSSFTSVTCAVGDCTANAPISSQSITGDVVVDGGLGSSSSTISPNIISYSFTDGVNTISSSTPGAMILGSPFFQTDAAGGIQGFSLAATSLQSSPSGSSQVSMSISSLTGDASSYSGLSLSGSTLSLYQGTATTPIPGIWSSPPAPSLYLTVFTKISQIPTMNQLSWSLEPVDIGASLTLSNTKPKDSFEVTLPKALLPEDKTLQDVAKRLAYIGFDWDQSLVWPSPTPLYACKDPSCHEVEQVGSTKMSDPGGTYGFGLDYCNNQSNDKNLTHYVGGDCAHAYYYNPIIATNLDESNKLCVLDYKGECLHRLTESNDTVLNFFDSPRDPCLVNQSAVAESERNEDNKALVLYGPSYVYQNDSIMDKFGRTAKILCGGTTTEGKGEEVFKTDLIGLREDGPPDILATFDWTDTFNGWLKYEGTGGIVVAVAAASDQASDPTSGTGGITVININGQPVAAVPEPPSGILFLGFTLCFIPLLGLHAKRNKIVQSRIAS
jgi:hypothetical protein